jgi:outer membrane protein
LSFPSLSIYSRIGPLLMQIGAFMAGGSLLLLCSCSLNRALIDPWSFAPEQAYCVWNPDETAAELRCKQQWLPELPDPNHPLSLAEVLDIALLNNPSTQNTWAEAREAAAIYAQAQSALLPVITGTYSVQRSRTAYLSSQFDAISQVTGKTILLQSTQSQWGPQLQLSYTIFDFGQRRATTEAARYSLYFSNYTHNRAIQTLLETVTADYYNYLYQIKLMEAYEANLASAQETYDAASAALKQGTQNVSDQLQAKTQLLQTEMQLIGQNQTIVNARAALLADMGIPASELVALSKMPSDYPSEMPLGPLEAWLAVAKENRPDLLGARASLASAEENLIAANRAFLPNLDYSLNFGKTFFSGGFHDKYDYLSVLTLNIPIFSGFWYRNNIRKAEAAKRAADAGVLQVELQVVEDVTSAYSEVTVSLDLLKAAHDLLKTTEEEYKVAIAQYRAGTGNILTVTSAQSSLFNARATFVKGMQQWLVSLSTLSYSAGTLSKPPSEVE